MFSYFAPQQWYLVLQEDGAEVFIHQWGHLKERCFLKTPIQLIEKISLNCPTTITILIDHESEILETGMLPKASFLDQKSLLINYLRAKFPPESWFGGMYLKAHQKDRPFLGIAFQTSDAIKAWMVPLKEKGIRIYLTFFVIEAQDFLRQNLKKVEKINPFVLLMPWNEYLKQMLFLNGEIRHLRTIKKPSSMEEYRNQIISFNHYVKRQHHLSSASLPIVYVKVPKVQEIPEGVKEVVEVQDFTKEVISHIKIRRLSRFRMLQFPDFGMVSYKRLIYKYGLFCLFSGAILGTIFAIKHFWPPQEDQKTPQKIVQNAPLQKSLQTPVTLYLAAIFYLDEKTWTLWLNGQKITTLQGVNKLGYNIVHVTEQQITLREIDSKNPVITLKPNQTFIAHKRCIKEGDWQGQNN